MKSNKNNKLCKNEPRSQEVQSQVELYKLIGGSWPPAPIEPENTNYGTVPRSRKPTKRTPSQRNKSVNIVEHLVPERNKQLSKSIPSLDKTKSITMADSKRIETGILVDIASSNGLNLNEDVHPERQRVRSSPPTQLPGDIGVGSLVEVAIDVDKKYYGVVRWIGLIDDAATAGIELEEMGNGLGDGCHGSRRLFSCAPGKALFVPLALCRMDSRFDDYSSVCEYRDDASALTDQPDCPLVAGVIPPLSKLGDLVGKNRGIQGHHNSCYLDATLFSMFTFTSVFDSLLYRPPEPEDCPQYSEVQRVLREEVVNPLRRHGYVRADRVMRLRTLLEKLSDVSGLTSEEKDPEEFLNGLVAQILRAEPFLKLSSGQESYCYQLFVEKDEQISLPTVQQLLEQSFATSGVKLTEVPATLIVQMPRFGKQYKLYPRLLPSPLLDVTDLIEGLPRQCAVCGGVSRWECVSCVGRCGSGLASTAFCDPCLRTAHLHLQHPQAKPLTVNEDYESLLESCPVPRVYMELFAVLCIETSHYVAFVKTGAGNDAPWCFFDSMADRKGERNGYNIPEIVVVEEASWLSEEGARQLHEATCSDRQLPPQAKRLLCDAYMCFYRSPDVAMYR